MMFVARFNISFIKFCTDKTRQENRSMVPNKYKGRGAE